MADGHAERIVVVIPARGGSKRVPKKNIRLLAGHPLIAHTIMQARRARLVSGVYVSTNATEIAAIARRYGAESVWRPEALATDTASSESAVLHALAEIKRMSGAPVDIVVMLQCTSPVRAPEDIDRAIEQLREERADSLLSVCRSKHFFWRKADSGAYPVNYDYRERLRSQDFDPQFQENGSIYVTRADVLRRSGNRLGGRIALYEMGYWSGFEIDDEHDIRLVEWIMTRSEVSRAGSASVSVNPRLLVFDFDGVMTDNTAYLDEDGKESVCVHRGDGLGIGLLKEAEVPLLVLSTEENTVVRARCEKLGIPCLHGKSDKAKELRALLQQDGIDPHDVIYVGNDVNDLGCLRMVGCAVAVADAHEQVIRMADIVLTRPGGRGAVRELAEMVLAGKTGGR